MNESQFGDKIRHILNQGLSLDSRKAARLQAARELALARKRPEPVGVLASAGVWAGNIVGDFGGWTGLSLRLLRSEEHTSELQSRFDLVCRLLLEQKKPTALAAADAQHAWAAGIGFGAQ